MCLHFGNYACAQSIKCMPHVTFASQSKLNIKAIRFTKSVSAMIYSLRCEVLLSSSSSSVVHENGEGDELRTKSSSHSTSALENFKCDFKCDCISLNSKLDFLAFCTLVDLFHLYFRYLAAPLSPSSSSFLCVYLPSFNLFMDSIRLSIRETCFLLVRILVSLCRASKSQMPTMNVSYVRVNASEQRWIVESMRTFNNKKNENSTNKSFSVAPNATFFRTVNKNKKKKFRSERRNCKNIWNLKGERKTNTFRTMEEVEEQTECAALVVDLCVGTTAAPVTIN